MDIDLSGMLNPRALRELAASVATYGSAIILAKADPATTYLTGDELDNVILRTDPQAAEHCWILLGDTGQTCAYCEIYAVNLDGHPAWLTVAVDTDADARLWRSSAAAYGAMVAYQAHQATRWGTGHWRTVTSVHDIPDPGIDTD